jgi:phage gpG-like protein
MPDPFEIPLQRLRREMEKLKPALVDGIGVEAVKFIDDNFVKQGFQGQSFRPWPVQKNPNKPRPHKILILTGTLRRSFKQTNHEDSVTISTDIPYARVHDEGARGPVTVKSKAGKTFTRNMNTPQRQFIGSSPVLTKACQGFIIKKVTNQLKNIS